MRTAQHGPLVWFVLMVLWLVPVVAQTDTNVHELTGLASWYGRRFQGRLTANGETFDTNELTAAHKTLPFDTIVRVTNQVNGLAVVVRINDRGPFVENRIIDLSRAAADIIELTSDGIAPVELELLHLAEPTDLRTVQIGSYSRHANAASVAMRLGDEGIAAVIETDAQAGLHRVIVQGVRESEVQALRTRLAAHGFPNVLVRHK